ncbi:Phage like integrase [gamma proteobacterium IMCC1989]|nr:Phage like integrase [gamma proteobacterium IMCC1989]
MWTDRQLKAIKPDPERKVRLTDSLGQRGAGKLVLEIQPNGVKSFYYQHFFSERGKSKRQLIKLGRYKTQANVSGLTLTEARSQAIALADRSTEGDLKLEIETEQNHELAKQREKDSANASLKTIFESYLADKDLKVGTVYDYRKTMQQTFSEYLDKPINTINRELILKIYRKRSKESPARANNAMRVFRAVYNYHRAVTRLNNGDYLLPENPVSILNETKVIKKVARRSTYIPRETLPAWFEAVRSLKGSRFNSGDVISDYFIFVLLTGTRREEARMLKKRHVDLKRKTFRLVDTKNREVVELPMSQPLVDLITLRMSEKGEYLFTGQDSEKPFNSFKRPLEHLQKEVGLNFSTHDLRRTFATVAESLDISTYTIKKLINHKINDALDVTAGYVIVDLDRMRKATEKISSELLKGIVFV